MILRGIAPPETCCDCDAETDRDGRSEDSRYTPDGAGPFCSDCWEEGIAIDTRDQMIAKLRTEVVDLLFANQNLRAEVERLTATRFRTVATVLYAYTAAFAEGWEDGPNEEESSRRLMSEVRNMGFVDTAAVITWLRENEELIRKSAPMEVDSSSWDRLMEQERTRS